MNLTITDIEKAIIARIKDQLQYLKTCESWSAFRITTLQNEAFEFPAVYVVFDRAGTIQYVADSIQNIPLTFRAIVMQHTLGIELSGVESRHGDGAQVMGVYDILEDLRAALTGYKDSSDFDILQPILPQSIQSIFQNENISIYSIELALTERYTHSG
jgi:phage gp37-like protein